MKNKKACLYAGAVNTCKASAVNYDSTPVNFTAVNYRVKRLLKEKVIVAFRANIDVWLLGYDYYNVFLTLCNTGKLGMVRIMEFLRRNPNVIYVTKPFSMYSLEFEAVVKNAGELHSIMNEFKAKFNELCVGYDIHFTSSLVDLSYVPGNFAV